MGDKSPKNARKQDKIKTTTKDKKKIPPKQASFPNFKQDKEA